MSTLNPAIDIASSKTTHTSGLNNLNLLQPNGFRLIVDRKNFKNLEFFAQTISHPSIDAPTVEVAYSRAAIAVPADRLTFGELTVMVLLDENMNSYVEMHNWISRIVEENHRKPLDRTQDLPPIQCDITVSILSSHNNTIRKIKYIDCIPTSLGTVDLETTNGETVLTYPVSFKFSYFEIS